MRLTRTVPNPRSKTSHNTSACIFGLHLSSFHPTMRALKHPDTFSDQSDDEKDIGEQLRSALRQDLLRTLQSRLPILTHLNADTTWLLSLPVPCHATAAKSKKRKRKTEAEPDVEDVDTVLGTAEEKDHGKAYFHLLIDPWLKRRRPVLQPTMARARKCRPNNRRSGRGNWRH
jgi:hypothetical protein